jgi:hypothetical protein
MGWEKVESISQDTTMPALVLIVDELAQFVDNIPRDKMRQADQFQDNIQKIARLGRAAHVHVILATQSCTGNLFPSSLKNNIGFRNICGRVEGNISQTAIGSEEGESLSTAPGSYLGYSKQETQPYQGYYTNVKQILSMGTVKPGYNPETGLELEEVEEDDGFVPIVLDDPNNVTSQEPQDTFDEETTLEEDQSEEPAGSLFDFMNDDDEDSEDDDIFERARKKREAKEQQEENEQEEVSFQSFDSFLGDDDDDNDMLEILDETSNAKSEEQLISEPECLTDDQDQTKKIRVSKTATTPSPVSSAKVRIKQPTTTRNNVENANGKIKINKKRDDSESSKKRVTTITIE